ncbi:hypothetical protein [Terriglobus tenax]|uniref:hypothetical protein n=1 Tax=Terriglobus tenax TaxID=1111115 RepID=UPI0021E04625|nr:hypothetical protein [Terriglobus tenax]
MTHVTTLLLFALGFQTAPAPLADPVPPTVSFIFDRPQVKTSHYEIILGEDGKGIYRAVTKDGVHSERAITVSPANLELVWAEEKASDGFRKVTCETHLKNMAQTGKKTLRWTGASDTGNCTYNYSDDKDIQKLTSIFQGIAMTMETGQRLAYLHRFDRLGLDAEITSLGSSVKSGWAIELQNIEPELRKIIADVSLMDRVRSKAETLLTNAK